MKEMIADCLIRICRFARAYRLEHRTGVELYEASGYAECHEQITQEDIENSVRSDLSLVDEWIAFTDDKRHSPAWGLTKDEKMWWVFHKTREANTDYSFCFVSPISACALMIRLEMEDFRKGRR